MPNMTRNVGSSSSSSSYSSMNSFGRVSGSRSMLDLRNSANSSAESAAQSTTASRGTPSPRADAMNKTLQMSERLAASASADLKLKTLLARVASGVATLDELEEFKGYVSAISLASDALADTAKDNAPAPRKEKHASCYTQPFLDFINENPTVFHTVEYFEKKFEKDGFVKLNERLSWASGDLKLEKGGKYYLNRNGSSLIAFVIGENYKVGESGVAMIAGHVDALTARLKPVSKRSSVQGFTLLGVAPYAGALNNTWFDRDLGIGGRVIVKGSDGKVSSKLVKLDWPIARIPTLAPHFGLPSAGPFNKETQMAPIIGIDGSSEEQKAIEEDVLSHGASAGTFASQQPARLVQLIANAIGVTDYSSILNWELELFDTQTAVAGGMNKEFIFAPRIDDKLCSWSAAEGLLEAADAVQKGSSVSLVGLFDDEEIGSRLRQGAAGNFLPGVVERIVDAFAKEGEGRSNLLSQTYANSFLVSADVTHAVNPNFVSAYLTDHMPKLNVGVTIAADSNGHMTTDSLSSAFLSEVAKKSNSELQVFQIRNDSRSGGTVGPMLSSAMGVRAIDAGLPQLSMHSIRATTGALDPGLGARLFRGFYEFFEDVDAQFKDIV